MSRQPESTLRLGALTPSEPDCDMKATLRAGGGPAGIFCLYLPLKSGFSSRLRLNLVTVQHVSDTLAKRPTVFGANGNGLQQPKAFDPRSMA